MHVAPSKIEVPLARERILDRQPAASATNKLRRSQLATSFSGIYNNDAFHRTSLLDPLCPPPTPPDHHL